MPFENFGRDTRRFVYTSSRIIITRFPFWEAFSTAMLLGELDGRGRLHHVPDYAIYAHIGVCIILGSLMSFDEGKRRFASQLSAAQMAFVAFASFGIWNRTNQMMALKIVSRYLGVMASYLLLSGGFADMKASHRRFAQLGNFTVGMCLISEAYLLYSWPTERAKVMSLLPSQLMNYEEIIVIVYCALFCLCAFCFMSGSNLNSGSKCALALWFLVVLFNLDYKYWANYVELWTQFRIIAADICFTSLLAVNYVMRS
ncbi:transmembrane protein 101-like [Styela clava]